MLQVGGEGESPQADHYTPMMDPSARRVDYLDLATPQSASRSLQAMHRPGQRAPSPTHLQRPQAPFFADDVLMYPPPPKRVPFNHDATAGPWPGNVGRQIAPYKRRRHKRPGIREHDREVYKVGLQHRDGKGAILVTRLSFAGQYAADLYIACLQPLIA